MKAARNLILAAICMAAQIAPCLAASDSVASLVFPTPREITAAGNGFILDSQVTIAVPSAASQGHLLRAHLLTDELGDRFGLHLKTERVTSLDSGGE